MEKILYVTAHDDDFDAMLSYDAMRKDVEAHVLIGSAGKCGINRRTDEPDYVTEGRRVEESAASLPILGVPPERQHHLYEPDGNLEDSEDFLAKEIADYVKSHRIQRIISLGKDGGDRHKDHKATHRSVVKAVGNLAAEGIIVIHEGLNAHHEGTRRVAANEETRRRKVAAMAMHRSQYNIVLADDSYDGEVIGGHAFDDETRNMLVDHMPFIIEGETYDRYDSAQAEDQADKQLLAA
jgi:LmbE family N-acetylglucosaminyl deacetylase